MSWVYRYFFLLLITIVTFAENSIPSTIQLSLAQQKLLKVRSLAASEKPLITSILTTGKLTLNQNHLTRITTHSDGWLEKIYCDFNNHTITTGDPIADIYSPEIFTAEQDYLSMGRGSFSPTNNQNDPFFMAARQKLKLLGMTEQQIRQIEHSKTALHSITLYSPISGFVQNNPNMDGTRIDAEEKFLEIANLDELSIIADIPAFEAGNITISQNAVITFTAFPKKTFRAIVDYIYPENNNENQTTRVRLALSNAKHFFKPLMYCTVSFKVFQGKHIVVSPDAILEENQQQLVYIDKGSGFYSARQITVGPRNKDYVSVLSGLNIGEKVVCSANQILVLEAQFHGPSNN